jgi:hypothetical protein
MLAAQFDPFPVDISADGVLAKPAIHRLAELSAGRLLDRASLLAQFDKRMDGRIDREEAARLDDYHEQAISILTGPSVQQAFDLERESEVAHVMYGRHRQGQSLLLARRLVEAGARFISVYWGPDEQDWADGQSPKMAGNPWDTHRNHFPLLRDSIFPRFDQALAALITDLADRGLLDETLVVWMGDFGRTPRISRPWASRDHWPAAFTVMLAGGGVKGGCVFGRTDKIAAEVTENPVSPADLTATIFAALGIAPDTVIRAGDGSFIKPSTGRVVPTLFV